MPQTPGFPENAGGGIVGFPTPVLGSLTAITSVNGTVNATFAIPIGNGAPAVLVQLDQNSGTTGGAVRFQVSYDGTNFVNISTDAVIDPTSATLATITLPYTLAASTNKAFLLLMKGAQALQILVSTAVTGTISTTPYYAVLPYDPVQQVSGIVTAEIAGHAGVTLDAVIGAAFPANVLALGAEVTAGVRGYNTPLTDGSAYSLQIDRRNNLVVIPGGAPLSGTVTSSTTVNTPIYTDATTNGSPFGTSDSFTNPPAWLFEMISTSTTGVITLQGQIDPQNDTWQTLPASCVLDPVTFAEIPNPLTFTTSIQKVLILTNGFYTVRGELTTVLSSGTGSFSFTPVPVLNLPMYAVSGATAPANALQVGGQYNSSAPSLSNSQFAPLQLNSSGALNVTFSGTVAVDGALTNNNAAPTGTLLGVLPAIAETAYTTVTYSTGDMVLPVTDLHGALNQDLQAIGGTAVRSNQTTTAAGVLDVNIVGSLGVTNSVSNATFMAITDNTTKVGVIVGTTALKTDQSSQAGTAITTVPVAFGTGTPSGNAPCFNGALYLGTTAVSLGQQVAGSSIPVILPSATITSLTPPTAAAIASAIVSNPPTVGVSGTVTTTTIPATSGGCSTAVSQALTSSVNVKASAGQLYGYTIYNPNAGTVYIFWYNTTTTPGTIGSTTNLIYQIGIATGSAAHISLDNGIAFSSGIAVAVSTSATSSAAPGTGLVITTLYK